MKDIQGLTKELNEGVQSIQTQTEDLIDTLKQLQQEYERLAKEFKL